MDNLTLSDLHRLTDDDLWLLYLSLYGNSSCDWVWQTASDLLVDAIYISAEMQKQSLQTTVIDMIVQANVKPDADTSDWIDYSQLPIQLQAIVSYMMDLEVSTRRKLERQRADIFSNDMMGDVLWAAYLQTFDHISRSEELDYYR